MLCTLSLDHVSFLSAHSHLCAADVSFVLQMPTMSTVGARSLASDRMVVGVPWLATDVPRVSRWRSLSVKQTGSNFETRIDHSVVRTHTPATNSIDSVLIQAGHMLPGVEDGVALWDALMLLQVYDGTSLVANTTATQQVHKRQTEVWQLVDDTANSPPPSRQGHTMATVNGAVYLFGGERSGFMRNDLWRLDCEDETWEAVDVIGVQPDGRYGHSATVFNDTSMCIVGGRSMSSAALSDVWCIDVTAAAPMWQQLEQDLGFKGRLGHSAVPHGNLIVVFGGLVPEDGALTSETWTVDVTSGERRNLGPLQAAFTAPSNSFPTNGITLPQAIPEPRVDHGACANNGKMWVMGGSTGPIATQPAGDVWVLDIDARTWQLVSAGEGPAFFDGATACADTSARLLFGGNAGGLYESQMHVVPLVL